VGRTQEGAVRNHFCDQEEAVLSALKSSRLNTACEPGLAAHVEVCSSCSQLADLARELLDDHRAVVSQAQVPSSAIVWWRAQMRSRREAALVVTQPMTFVQGLILACAAGLTVAAVGFFVPTFRRAFEYTAGATDVIPSISWSLAPEVLANPIVMAGVAALALCAIVVPLALYFTFQEE
jgi:hypothetical protein